MSKEAFKNFVSKKPELISQVNSGNMTWQKFYDIYNIYGEDSEVWDSYITKETTSSVDKFSSMLRNIDINSIKEHINTAQKALDLVQELTSKESIAPQKFAEPRPLTKFFED